MGCAQSKIENEEAVSRCKDRRNFMKEAVTARNAFASGHSAYAMALKNTGAALSDYAQGEVEEIYHPHLGGGGGGGEPSEPPPPPPPIMEQPPPPPPPPSSTYSPVPPPMPSFSPTPTTPLQRSVTMPAISVTKKNGRKINNGSILEEDEEEEEEEEDNVNDLRGRKGRKGSSRMPKVDETPSPLSRTPVAPPPPESKGMAWDYFFMVDNMPGRHLSEEEEDDDDDIIHEKDDEEDEEEEHHLHHHQNHHIRHHQVEPKTPEKVVMEGFTTEEEETPVMVGMKDKQFLHSNTAPPDLNRRSGGGVVNGGGGMVVGSSNVNLLKIFGQIDDHFLKASESAQEVSKMLEATRLHYHSNFADNRGHIDHAARVMRVITWNRSFKGAGNGENGNDEYDEEKYETHATVLDKLLAWEKKLYEEVKAGELMKLEYQRKVALLNKLKKRGASTESLEKTKAAVSHLHTRYIVDMQSLDSTVSEVNDIRDKQLYPKLVALVDGMSKMWDSMCEHHDNQLTIVTDLKSLDVSGAAKETTKQHYETTVQLYHVVQGWHSHFETLVTHQKHYVQALNNWLKLNLVPIESSLKEKISSPPRVQNPPIQALLHSWHDHLQKLPDELAKSAISSFAAVIETIMNHQEEEMKLKDKWEETRKEYLRKTQAFEDWYHKYIMRRGPQDETDTNRGTGTDPVAERQFVVETLKKRLEDEMEAHQKLCIQVRDKSLGSLKIRLPELFRAMSDYAHVCRDSYRRLRSIMHSQNRQNGS
uniref:protein ROLLING AND ERECT LEAF 2 n=1 Tax=Erigeron canadensis TaxID=72917 RepID=UPI001CB97831|nr:protein ROLLING AND ERECT LEAF 2 [Erigeron canadensis]